MFYFRVVSLLTISLVPQPFVSWGAFYDGPAHEEDKATGLLVDSAGHCYLTGYSFGKETDFDFATVKFNSRGETLWTRRYGSPLNCEDRSWCSALDYEGNLIVCGGSIADMSHGWDFLVIKSRPDGETVWLRRLDFPEHGDDKPAGLAIAPDNSILIVGASRHQGRRRDWDIATVKLSPQGDTVWTRLFNGPASGDDYGLALAVDSGGNCYVTGKVVRSPPWTDIALLKFSPEGRLFWQKLLDGPGRMNDFPAGLVLDRSGGYLFGTVTGKGTGFDYFIARFTQNGKILWQRSYDGAHRGDFCQAGRLESAGNLTVTGQSTGQNSSFDIATLKFSSSGRLLWENRYNGPANGADRGYCVTEAGSDRVLVGGTSEGASGYPELVLVSLASASGDSLWTFRYSGGGAGESRPVALRVVGNRTLVAGWAFRPESGFDYLLLCLERE